MHVGLRIAVGIGCGALAAAADAAERVPPPVDYLQLRETRFATDDAPLPAGGAVLVKDDARIELLSGRFRLMEPTDGAATGLAFEGSGRLHIDVADPFEREQFRRFSGAGGGPTVDLPFRSLVLRTVDPLPAALTAAASGSAYARYGPAFDRRESWLTDWGLDVDARVVAGRLNGGDGFFVADVKTEDHGWLRLQFEPWEAEELTLGKLHGAGGFREIWLSLDRAADRAPSGAPGSRAKRLFDLSEAEIEIDLGNHRAQLRIGAEQPPPDRLEFRARLAVTVLQDGVRALPFELDTTAVVSAVRLRGGEPLAFLQDPFGKRYILIANDRTAGVLIVLADRPWAAGERVELEFDYVMKTLNYVTGRDWYPGGVDALADLHTARLVFRGPQRLEVRAAGALESDTVEGDLRTSTWSVRKPTRMIGFSFGSGFKEETIRLENAPEVAVFGTPTGVVFGKTVRNVAIDVARAAQFFERYFETDLPYARIRATAIAGTHGQAFDGFLHLAQGTFNHEAPGFAETFRAHETAHLYWGHLVGWTSYRDQWLSEGFAEYSGLMYADAALPKARHLDARIADYASEQLGSLQGGTALGIRFGDEFRKPAIRAQVGPIAAGYRAATVRAPWAAMVQLYHKGALVLHTIRTVLSSITREPDLFQVVLRDFIESARGGEASTADFQAILERRVEFPWEPFFRTYVHGCQIPSYAWRWRTATEETRPVLYVTVEASNVSPGFVLPIPLGLELRDGTMRYTFVRMEGTSKTFRIPVPTTPTKVFLNPRNGVLASVREVR